MCTNIYTHICIYIYIYIHIIYQMHLCSLSAMLSAPNCKIKFVPLVKARSGRATNTNDVKSWARARASKFKFAPWA